MKIKASKLWLLSVSMPGVSNPDHEAAAAKQAPGCPGDCTLAAVGIVKASGDPSCGSAWLLHNMGGTFSFLS